MISFSRLGVKGNLGNSLFQIASTLSLGKKHKHEVSFPQWQHEHNFKNSLHHKYSVGPIKLKEQHFHHYEWEIGDGNYDIDGWLQSEKYFDEKLVRKQFEFTDELLTTVKKKAGTTFDKKTILISIRRGDFVGNPVYFQVPIKYYLMAMMEHFPDWEERNIVVTSDDMDYCKLHFDCIDNVFFAEDMGAIEQLCLGTLCDDFIISNSTFSWWQAWLGEKKDSKVIRPLKNFDNQFAFKNDDKDYFPDRWTMFDHTDKKIDLKDCTFVIPVSYDHADRKHNLDISVCLLQRDFDTNIIVGEQGGNKFRYTERFAKYVRFGFRNFHRTRMLNEMILASVTNYISNWDCDTILPPLRVYMSLKSLRNGKDFVYPFDGRVYHVPRIPFFANLRRFLDVGIFGMDKFLGKNGKEIISSVGHAVFCNRDKFIECGMENEYMISYAPEDCERWERYHRLGYKVERIKGAMFHLMHWRGKDSSSRNPFFKANHDELDKMRKMDDKETLEYIKTWPWMNRS